MTTDKAGLTALAALAGVLPTCADHDSDCNDITDKVHCWLYDPAKGMCPYLRALASKEPTT